MGSSTSSENFSLVFTFFLLSSSANCSAVSWGGFQVSVSSVPSSRKSLNMATTTEFGIKPSGAITNVSSSPSSAEEASRESLCDTSWRDWLGDGYRSDFGTSTTYRSRSRFTSGGSIGWLRKSCLWEGAEWDILELVSSWEKISLSVSKVKGRSDLWRMSHKSLLVIYLPKFLIFRIEVFCMCLDCLLTHLISIWSIRELKQKRFWETDVNRKWGLFPLNVPWHYEICIA